MWERMKMTTRKEIEDIFATGQSKSDHVLELNQSRRVRKSYEDNVYKHPLHSCIIDRGKDEVIRWSCGVHTMTMNVHFDTIVHHILFFEPDKHKEFILDNTFFS